MCCCDIESCNLRLCRIITFRSFLVWILAKVIIFRLADGAWARVRGRAGCPLDRIGLLFYAVLDAKRTI